jgi:hypothetical protein
MSSLSSLASDSTINTASSVPATTISNNEFSNSKVHSIYKKGKIREERINREDIVEISQVTIEELK